MRGGFSGDRADQRPDDPRGNRDQHKPKGQTNHPIHTGGDRPFREPMRRLGDIMGTRYGQIMDVMPQPRPSHFLKPMDDD